MRVVEAAAATDVYASSARLSAEVVQTGGDDPVITVFWGEDDGGTDPDEWEDLSGLGARAQGDVAKDLAGLDKSLQYNYRFRAKNSAGAVWTPAKTFTTLAAAV